MKYTIIFIASLLFATQITGAFGIKLGEKITLDKIKVLNIQKNTLNIIPPKTLPIFDKYKIKITPISKKVYEIKASKKYENSDKCHTEVKKIKVILENKYGKFNTDLFAVYPFFTYEKNNKKIILECKDNNIDYSIFTIIYTDKKLEKKAKEEKIILKSKNIQDTL